MPLTLAYSANDKKKPQQLEQEQSGPRISALKQAVENAIPGICPERALLWSAYAKKRHNKKKNSAVQVAEALAFVLDNKSIAVYPHELLVGNYTSRRVGGMIAPELAGFTALAEIPAFPQREENPLEISAPDMVRLAKTLPFWLPRTLAWRACPSALGRPGFIARNALFKKWVINELGGIAHFAPDYEKLLAQGVEGIIGSARKKRRDQEPDSETWQFLTAVIIAGEALARFGNRYSTLAFDLARKESDPSRKKELLEIARTCCQVPRHGATSFREALQSVLLAHIAIVHEGLDVSICPGRMDQYLWPYYKKDLVDGQITPQEARELLDCFCIKLCETVPVWSRAVNRMFSGLPSYQTVCVGGTDKKGKDAVNDLSYMLLDITGELRMREPNFHARIHKKSPKPWLDAVYRMLAKGANTPALYNDEVIVPALVNYGLSLEDARNYTPIGCVEPGSQGKSFGSTDAALVNVPVALERALNGGKRFGGRIRTGAVTMPVSRMKSMEDVKNAFSIQLAFLLKELVRDLRWVEKANADYHPTPLSSMLMDGCIDSARCLTQGGATYNASGVQFVGPADVGDSLAAIEQLVFEEKRITLAELVEALKENLPDESLRARLKKCRKFGNDDPAADFWTQFVVEEFVRILEGHGSNTRGGRYVAGLYSTTTHEHFGRVTGATPNGRRKGEPFASGIAPANGSDKKGPTALLNSMNRLDYSLLPNGVNFNIKFASNVLAGEKGAAILQKLMQTYFERGGMQAQLNVLDRQTLQKIKENPDAYPNLLVRVSGYSAYFNNLTEPMKDEIIARTANSI